MAGRGAGRGWGAEAWKWLSRVREVAPLVQCIANFVAMEITSSTLLAVGASPAMGHALEEIPEFSRHADSLCISTGSLAPAEWFNAMKTSALHATGQGKPWVLDPMGVGASHFRTQCCCELLALHPSIIRGNASEIMALLDATKFQGEESANTMPKNALEAAKELAISTHSVVAVSGAVDLVTDGTRVLGVSNGVALMQRISSTGCAVTALIAAFASINPGQCLEASAFALALFGLAGELAQRKANGPATLRMHLLDVLHNLDEASVTTLIQIAQI